MRIGVMLGDIVRSLLKKPDTEMYPYVREPAPDALRGALWFKPENCTGCAMCVKDCPANALELSTIDKKAKRFVLTYRIDRCTFCGQCVKSCNNKSLGMSSEEWELAALKKDVFTVHLGREEDIHAHLAAPTDSSPVPPAENTG